MSSDIFETDMNADDDPLIYFSDEEKAALPCAGKSLPILIPAAKACFRFLNPAKHGVDNTTGITWFINSVDCAMQVTQRSRRDGPVDLVALISTIDIPHIENTLPVLVEGFEKSRSVWENTEPFYSLAMWVLFRIGIKMYPGGLDEHGVLGYRDIFDDDGGGSSSLIRLHPLVKLILFQVQPPALRVYAHTALECYIPRAAGRT